MKRLSAQLKFSPGTAPKWILMLGLVYFAVMFVENMLFPCMHNDERVIGFNTFNIIYGRHHLFCDGIWPLAYSAYTGFLKAYTAIPVALIFGPRSLCSIRLQYLFWGLGGMWAMFCVLRRILGLWPASLAVVLLSVDTFFIRCAISGVYRDEVIGNALFWVTLVCLFRAFDNTRRFGPWLFAAGLCAGLGMWAKFSFAGYIIGAAVCVPVISRDTRKLIVAGLFSPFLRRGFVLVMGFVVGFAPRIYHDVLYGYPSGRMLLSLFGSSDGGGWDNSAFVFNFMTRLWNLFNIVASWTVPENIEVYNVCALFPDFAQTVLCFFAVVWLLHGLVSGREAFFVRPEHKDALRAITAMSVALLLFLCVLPGEYNPDHVLGVLPFMKIIIAVFCVAFCAGNFPGVRKFVVVSGLCLSFLIQSGNMIGFMRIAKSDCGMNGAFHPLRMEFVRAVVGRNINYIIDTTALTWDNSLEYFTNGRVAVYNYSDFWDEDSFDALPQFQFNKSSGYMLLMQIERSDANAADKLEMLGLLGTKMKLIKSVRSSDNEVIFLLYEVMGRQKKRT